MIAISVTTVIITAIKKHVCKRKLKMCASIHTCTHTHIILNKSIQVEVKYKIIT